MSHRGTPQRYVARLAILVLSLAFGAPAGAQQITVEPILLEGFLNAALPLEPGVWPASANPIAILDTGEILIALRLAGPGITPLNDDAVVSWSEANGFTLIRRDGSSTPPDIIIHVVERSGRMFITDRSSATYQAYTLTGQPPLSFVYEGGGPAPGMPSGATFASDFLSTFWYREGASTIKGTAVGGGVSLSDDTGFWKIDVGTGAVELLVREGDPAPTGIPGETFHDFGPFGSAVVNPTGSGALIAKVGNNRRTAWQIQPDGSLDLRVRAGNLAPEIGSGVTLIPDQVDVSPFTQSGFVMTSLLGGGSYSGFERAYYHIDAQGQRTLLHACNFPIPGLPSIPAVCVYDRELRFESDGRSRFTAYARNSGPGASGSGIWDIVPGTGLVAVATSDSQPPLNPGETFVWNYTKAESNILNQILVWGLIRDDASGDDLGDAIIFYPPNESPVIALQEGDLIEVAPGLSGPVTAIISSNFDGRVLNDSGQFVFEADVAGLTGIFRGQLSPPSVPVPFVHVGGQLLLIFALISVAYLPRKGQNPTPNEIPPPEI